MPLLAGRPVLLALARLAGLLLPVIATARPLVDPARLQVRLGQPGRVLLDAPPRPIQRAGHIPGAVDADLMFGGTALPTQAQAQAQVQVQMQMQMQMQMQGRLEAWGIAPDSRIVVYANQDTMWAPRVVPRPRRCSTV